MSHLLPCEPDTPERGPVQRYKDYAEYRRPWWKPVRGNDDGRWAWMWNLVQFTTFYTATGRRLVDGDPMVPGTYVYGGTRVAFHVGLTNLRLGVRLGSCRKPFARRQHMGGAALTLVLNVPLLELRVTRGWYGP